MVDMTIICQVTQTVSSVLFPVVVLKFCEHWNSCHQSAALLLTLACTNTVLLNPESILVANRVGLMSWSPFCNDVPCRTAWMLSRNALSPLVSTTAATAVASLRGSGSRFFL